MASKTLCARSTVMPWYSFRSSRSNRALTSLYSFSFLIMGFSSVGPRPHLVRIQLVELTLQSTLRDLKYPALEILIYVAWMVFILDKRVIHEDLEDSSFP